MQERIAEEMNPKTIDTSRVALLGLGLSLALAATGAWAIDGGGVVAPPDGGGGAAAASAGGGETYFEGLLGGTDAAAFESAEPGLPTELFVVDGSATLAYHVVSDDGETTEWEALVRDFARPHERVDAVYDLILALPLPVGNGSGFEPLDRGIALREGSEASSVPVIYGGQKVVLKRNVALEKSLLPGLLDGAGDGKLPAIQDPGYRYTLWDAIVLYDAGYGDSVQGWAKLRYRTSSRVPEPDASGAGLAAYAITWIPSLPSAVPPYAVRIDAASAD